MPLAAEPLQGRARLFVALGLLLALGSLAWLAPRPAYETDRDIYRQIGRDVILPDCSSLHCTRILVAPILERLPMASLTAWKSYAVVANTIGALGVAALCGWFGFGAVLAALASAMVAFGRGAQLTVFDPYTSDPFIYALTPWMTLMLLEGRFARAGAAGTIGVFAKEFAAGPLWIIAVFGLLIRRRDVFVKSAFAALVATTTWLLFQLWLALRYNYSFGGNPSSQILAGGYLMTWVRSLGPLRAAESLVLHLGPLSLLAAVGFRRAPERLKRLATASVPAAIALCYVQQPDRALWNFAWVLVPLAVVLFDRQPTWLAGAWIASYAVSNLPSATDRIGLPVATAFVVCGICSVVIARAARARFAVPFLSASAGGLSQTPDIPPSSRSALAAETIGVLATLGVCAALLIVALDISIHRNEETGSGLNIWGYRGPVARKKQAGEVRVVVLGGSTVFGRAWQGSIPLFLEQYLNLGWMRAGLGYDRPGVMTVVNLATPYDRVQSFDQTLRDFETLDYDVVCLYVGHDDPVPSAKALDTGWRRQSAVFRATGYLPIIPSVLARRAGGPEPAREPAGSEPQPERLSAALSALDATIEYALARGKRVFVATHPFLSPDEAQRQDAIRDHLVNRFGMDKRFDYMDLRLQVDPADPALTDDGIHPIPPAPGRIAETMCYEMFRLLKRT